MRKAREEKERKQAMIERGIPKAKPLKPQQIAEQEAIKKMLIEKKGMVKSQMMTMNILNNQPNHERNEDEFGDDELKYKSRGQVDYMGNTEGNQVDSDEGGNMPLLPPNYLNEHIEEEGGPMSLTIVTKEHEEQQQ